MVIVLVLCLNKLMLLPSLFSLSFFMILFVSQCNEMISCYVLTGLRLLPIIMHERLIV